MEITRRCHVPFIPWDGILLHFRRIPYPEVRPAETGLSLKMAKRTAIGPSDLTDDGPFISVILYDHLSVLDIACVTGMAHQTSHEMEYDHILYAEYALFVY